MNRSLWRSVALPLCAISLLAMGGCKDNKPVDKMKPVGPAGAEGATGKPEATGANKDKNAWPEPVVTQTAVEGGTQIVSKVMASPPANTTEGDDQKRMAMGAAQMRAQVGLLKAIEKRRGKKLGGAEIPAILRQVKVMEAKDLEGGAVSVSLGYLDKASKAPATAAKKSPTTGAKPAK